MVCQHSRCVAVACRAYLVVCGAHVAAEDAHDDKHEERAEDDAAAEEEDDEDDPQAKKRRQAREAEKRMREANEKAVGIIMKMKKVLTVYIQHMCVCMHAQADLAARRD
jgi:hypothetical protein